MKRNYSGEKRKKELDRKKKKEEKEQKKLERKEQKGKEGSGEDGDSIPTEAAPGTSSLNDTASGEDAADAASTPAG
ncbi:MAG: hypothetical protein NT080_09725 [Spirochaetes bacterium]|nr:hypothetical protein [Spirochaetota bacterium]